MFTLLRRTTLALALLVSLGGGPVEGQERLTVSVQQLFDQKHRLEVTAGSEVVWDDPHFDRVWFPAGANNPRVERQAGRFTATFARPGTYRGAFTVTGGGHATSDVYDMVVVVKPRTQ
jgi:hypothetical protein